MTVEICTACVFRLDTGPSTGKLRPAMPLAIIHIDRDGLPPLVRAELIVYGLEADGADWPVTGKRINALFGSANGRWYWVQ